MIIPNRSRLGNPAGRKKSVRNSLAKQAFLMPNSKPMGMLDVGAATCQSSRPSLCPCVSQLKKPPPAPRRLRLCVFRGHSPLGEAATATPQFQVSFMATKNKKRRKNFPCVSQLKTARPATFLFHFIFTRDTEAQRRAGRGMAMKTRFQNQKGTATMQGTARL
ncbi:MAG: hypothetical protein ACOX9C_06030, partial [Kiritimatiellia bacterium]